MKYLCVENKNEVTPEAFLLMGASTKRLESGKIGMFGTGFKMAVAVLLREQVPLVVISGGNRYRFGVEPVVFRDQTFQRITVQEGRRKSEPTQMTTAMAMQWGLNNGIREIISNAYDEQNAEVFISGELLDRPGYTRIYIQLTEEVSKVYCQFDRYFTFRRQPIVKGEGWAIYAPWGPGTRMYRRGVQVFEDTELSACFDYQYDSLEVREDRTSERYDCERASAWVMARLSLEQHERIMDFLCAHEDETFEGRNTYVCWHDQIGTQVGALLNGRVAVTSDELRQYKGDLAGQSTVTLPQRWIEAAKNWKGVKTLRDVISGPRLRGHRIVTASDSEHAILEVALGYCQSIGLPVDPETVSVFEADSPEAPRGYACDGAILINRETLGASLREIVKVLFEEFVHVDSGNPDYTRGFQHALLNHWLTCVEKFAPLPERTLERAAA